MKDWNNDFDEDLIRISLQNREFSLIIVISDVPKPYKWDMIPYKAGTLVYERKSRRLCRVGCSFFF